jgi:hypothetical protein
MLDINHNPMQILQARQLEESVRRLCSYDRRAVHPVGTQETLHCLCNELEKAQLKANLHRAEKIPIFKVRKMVKKAYTTAGANFAGNKTKQLLDQIPESHGNKSLDIVNLVTLIGDPNGKKIILGAHYDMDLFIEKGAGADDNASGVATLLQLAKNLKAHESKFEEARLCIEIVFFGAEENPFDLSGSNHYARKLRFEDEKNNLGHMLNLDMVGFFDDERDLDIYLGDHESDSQFGNFLKKLKQSLPKKENYYVIESYSHTWFANLLLTFMRNQSLVVEHLSPDRLSFITEDGMSEQHQFNKGVSDYNSFKKLNFPVSAISANPHRNRNYHTQADVPETLDYTRMSKLTDSLERFLLSLVENKKTP